MSEGIERPVRGVANLKPDCHLSSCCLLPVRLRRTVMLSWEVVLISVFSHPGHPAIFLSCQVVTMFRSPTLLPLICPSCLVPVGLLMS